MKCKIWFYSCISLFIALFLSFPHTQVVKAFVVLTSEYKHRDQNELIRDLQTHVKKVTAPYKYPRKVHTPILWLKSVEISHYAKKKKPQSKISLLIWTIYM